MASKTQLRAQLILRLALAFSFLSAVADRFGFWGEPGTDGVAWGNWQNFVAYSNSVNSFLPSQIGGSLAVMATALEVILALLLLVGYQLKLTAITSACLLAGFGIAMTISFGFEPALSYSVWTAAAASFLLSACAENLPVKNN